MSAPKFTLEEVAGTLKPRKEATWLAQRAYVDEEIFKDEMRSIFDKEWIALFHQNSLPQVGDYRALDVAGRPLLFVRGKDRELRCYINVCRHRGMAVADGVGNCKHFVCPYHNWVYDLEGKVINRPLYDGDVPLVDSTRLTEVRAEIFLGFVFVNFDNDAEPVASKYSGVAKELAAWDDADLEVMFENIYPCKWNWKLMWDNGIEAYHVAGTHRASFEDDMPTRLAYVSATDPENYTILHLPYETDRTFKAPDAHQLPPIPHAPSWVADEMRFYNMWPMSAIGVLGDAWYGYFIIPSARVDECHVMAMYAVRKEARQLPHYEEYRQSWSKYFDIIQDEDEAPCSRLQRTYESCRDWAPGPYAAAEATCWYFHNWYLKRLGVAEAARFLTKMSEPEVHHPGASSPTVAA